MQTLLFSILSPPDVVCFEQLILFVMPNNSFFLLPFLKNATSFDPDSCANCVDGEGCTFCVVDGVISCVCDAEELLSKCTGGEYSFTTNSKLACSPQGLILMILVPLAIAVSLCLLGCCLCCYRRRTYSLVPKDERSRKRKPFVRLQPIDLSKMVLVDEWGPTSIDTPAQLIGVNFLEIEADQTKEEQYQVEEGTVGLLHAEV